MAIYESHEQDRHWLLPIQKWPICPISALCEKFYPRNINYMHPKGISFGHLW